MVSNDGHDWKPYSEANLTSLLLQGVVQRRKRYQVTLQAAGMVACFVLVRDTELEFRAIFLNRSMGVGRGALSPLDLKFSYEVFSKKRLFY